MKFYFWWGKINYNWSATGNNRITFYGCNTATTDPGDVAVKGDDKNFSRSVSA